jgi:hypothetical protein
MKIDERIAAALKHRALRLVLVELCGVLPVYCFPSTQTESRS